MMSPAKKELLFSPLTLMGITVGLSLFAMTVLASFIFFANVGYEAGAMSCRTEIVNASNTK